MRSTPHPRVSPGASRLAPMLLFLAVHACQAVLPTPWGDLTPSAELELEHDSNVLTNGDVIVSSWIHRVRPELRFNRSKGSIVLEIVGGANWERFSSASSLNGFNPSISVLASHSGEVLRTSMNAGVKESAEVDTLRADRVRQRSWNGGLTLHRRLAGKWGAGVNGSWTRRSDIEGSSSQEEWEIGPRVTYAYNEFLDFYAGYNLRSVSTDASVVSPETEVSGFTAGVDGRLPIRILPRVNVTATAGWQTRSGVGSSTRGGLLGDASIEYELSGLTVVSLTVGQDFLTSLEGDSGRQTRALAAITHKFSDQIRCSAGATWSNASFDSGPSSGSSQTLTGGFLRADWRRSDYFTWYAHAAVTQSDSETARRNYSRTTFTAGVRITY